MIREMQIKTTMRYHITPLRMAIIKKSTNKCCQGCGGKGIFVHSFWECKLVQPLWKTSWSFHKTKIELPYDPEIPLLGIYPKKMKTLIWKDTCIPKFTAAFFFFLVKMIFIVLLPAVYTGSHERYMHESFPFRAFWLRFI